MDCTPEEGQHLLWSRLNMRETSREPLLSTNKYDDDSTKESLSDDGSNSMLDTGFHYQSATRSRRLRVVVAALGCLTACCLIASATLYLGYRLGLRNPHPTVLMPNADASCAVQWKALASPDNPSVETVLSADRDQSSIVFTNGTVYDRPAGLKIVAVVFYGRREYASILDCYLRRNLAVNGGILDEVRFVVHTQDEEDRRWLEDLVHDQDLEDHYILQYEATENDKWTLWHTFRYIWSTMTDPDTIYIKIDDDITHIQNNAVNELVRTAIEHPEAHSVIANVVNNAFTYWHHFRNGAIFPYLAEQLPLASEVQSSWRPSALPRYEGDLPSSRVDFTHNYSPPSGLHRWLPLQTSNFAEAMLHTPHGAKLPGPSFARFADYGGWAYAAQAHYSLFENLERGLVHKYHFGDAQEGLQNLWYEHYSINFMAIRGSNVALKPFWDPEAAPEYQHDGDETLLTEMIPRDLNMPVLLATRAVVAHFAYGKDRENVLKTDVLDRYRSYANEMVCDASNQKLAFTSDIQYGRASGHD